MKKLYTVFLALASFCMSKGQVANGSFENWYSDTATFSFGTFVPLDTFWYTSPVNWTCINAITMSPGLHTVQLVDSSPTAFSGSKSVYMRTDTIKVSAVNLNLILPGFVVNGSFHLTLGAFFGNSHLSPLIFQGAGVPYTQRLKSFGLYMKYLPVANDSCLMWAVLKKGNQVIGDARFSTTQTYNNLTYIQKDFTYYSCDMPDTLVILLSTSTPNLATLGSGNSGLTAGSQIWVDSVETAPFSGSFSVVTPAPNITTTTNENTSKTINILTADSDCTGLPLTVAITGNPLHGSANLDLSQNVVYIPASGFTGNDTIQYSISNGAHTNYGNIYINVLGGTFCDTLFIEHTYNWHNLNLKLRCVTMTGTVQLILPPAQTGDGDAHIYILPDAGYDSLVYSPTTFPTWLNVEETCVGTPLDTTVDPYCNGWPNPLYLPNVGERVRCTGPWVFDPVHGWNEIHPVSGMELLGATYVPDLDNTFLNDLKVYPQPASMQVMFAFSHPPHEPTYIRFYNSLGRNVGAFMLAETDLFTLNTSYWPAGAYVYTISKETTGILKRGIMAVVH